MTWTLVLWILSSPVDKSYIGKLDGMDLKDCQLLSGALAKKNVDSVCYPSIASTSIGSSFLYNPFSITTTPVSK